MAFEELKERQAAVWGSGAFDEVADTLADIHALVVDRLRPAPGERWLEVACGTGRLAEMAASAGATVVGVDLAPALVDVARHRAAERGLEIEYAVGDAEHLPVDDASFDVLSSTFGQMFAPDQAQTASEVARVVRPGGRIGLANWTPEGRIGAMFRTLAQFQQAPPPSNPLEWGRPEHVEELLGESFELTFERIVSQREWESGEAIWEFMSPRFGPLVALQAALDDEGRRDLRDAMIRFSEEARVGDRILDDREYLFVSGTRR